MDICSLQKILKTEAIRKNLLIPQLKKAIFNHLNTCLYIYMDGYISNILYSMEYVYIYDKYITS